jgi:hypothetical protein
MRDRGRRLPSHGAQHVGGAGAELQLVDAERRPDDPEDRERGEAGLGSHPAQPGGEPPAPVAPGKAKTTIRQREAAERPPPPRARRTSAPSMRTRMTGWAARPEERHGAWSALRRRFTAPAPPRGSSPRRLERGGVGQGGLGDVAERLPVKKPWCPVISTFGKVRRRAKTSSWITVLREILEEEVGLLLVDIEAERADASRSSARRSRPRVSTRPPRLVLMSITPGFIRCMAPVDEVMGVRGEREVQRHDVGLAEQLVQLDVRAPSPRASSMGYGSYASIRHPKPAMMRQKTAPIRPVPTTPTVRP